MIISCIFHGAGALTAVVGCFKQSNQVQKAAGAFILVGGELSHFFVTNCEEAYMKFKNMLIKQNSPNVVIIRK